MHFMKDTIREKLDQILTLKGDLQNQLSDQQVIQDMEKFQRLSKELQQMTPITDAYERYLSCLMR